MRLDLSCPIELRGYTLSYTEGAAQANVRLYNLTNRRIASFEAIAKWMSRSSERGVAMPFGAQRLRAGGENGFTIDLSCDRQPDADRLELVFTCVEFEDGGPDWRAGEGEIVEISPIEPIAKDDLAGLKALAGDDAVCFPRQNRQIWRCVCGRANATGDESCARCHRARQDALTFTPEKIRAHRSENAPAIHQDEEADIADLYKTFLRQRGRLLRRTLALALAALALTVLLVMNHEPGETGSANAEVISIYHQEETP